MVGRAATLDVSAHAAALPTAAWPPPDGKELRPMVSRILVQASESRRLERLATENPLAQRIARRFVAGDRLEDGVAAARALVARGFTVSLDLVGEHVEDVEGVTTAAEEYAATLSAMTTHGLPGGISVKPSQLGTELDVERCVKLLDDLAADAADAGAHVTLDMEDSSTTETTVRLIEELQARGHAHVGCAVQAALHRTPDDVRRLSDLGASLRLCKGAYAEPSNIAASRKAEVDARYRELATMLLERGTYPRFATHDHRLVGHVRREAARLGRTRDDYEFQMLYGVRTDLQQRLLDIGEHLCVYVPFGAAWYRYFVRRLAERPANLLFFLRALRG